VGGGDDLLEEAQRSVARDPGGRVERHRHHGAAGVGEVDVADAIARAIAFAIEQPVGVGVGEIVVRPTAQA
jgi:NADP-dependent 3-hydroxy acid dehydrogenase YdfG